MQTNLVNSVFVVIFALAQPISGIFTERCHHQQFLQVLADTKDCLASAEQLEGVCGVVEGRQRCLEERLSPCLTPSLIGKLIGKYRSIWRWEFEERYRQAADDERVSVTICTMTFFEIGSKNEMWCRYVPKICSTCIKSTHFTFSKFLFICSGCPVSWFLQDIAGHSSWQETSNLWISFSFKRNAECFWAALPIFITKKMEPFANHKPHHEASHALSCCFFFFFDTEHQADMKTMLWLFQESPHPTSRRCFFGQCVWLPGAISGVC